MENIELVSFQIISNTGMAKSDYMEAIQEAKKGRFGRAQEKIQEGDKCMIQGHTAHAQLIQQEAAGKSVSVNLLLMHAEDQLMNAETIKILALELIDLYQHEKSPS
ncbi:PTS lactose/cellobiose transporter subunit IIA [Faecalicoccus pleomorphus]|uniref:PTS lactose/cellobiose transporter subunit IIA n=1 Tax=Faecalicoccus pleomorphus TaxID=1323 RepID=UPI001431ED99|nr:PTS lactose/cellobiose transporter subunit IIA [Faecalicoccus pleomorphus]NJE40924.1 PTS lactose/cellobiose transporter subunit IIA [Faecalicoccus pleomorphus]